MNTPDVLALWRMWQEQQCLSDRTITERASTISKMLEMTGAQPLELTPLHILSFCSRSHLSAASKATYHASIRAYCQWLVAMELREDDPSKKTPTPKRGKSMPRPVADQALIEILSAANRRRTRSYILFAALAGLRVHEVAKLHTDDFDTHTVTVIGKGNKTALVPLHKLLAEEIKLYAPGYLFPSYTGAAPHIGPHAVSKAIRDATRRAGYSYKPHQLRHWFGTSLLANGADVRIVQTLMRHEHLTSTEIYTEVADHQRSAAISTLHIGTRLPQLPIAA